MAQERVSTALRLFGRLDVFDYMSRRPNKRNDVGARFIAPLEFVHFDTGEVKLATNHSPLTTEVIGKLLVMVD